MCKCQNKEEAQSQSSKVKKKKKEKTKLYGYCNIQNLKSGDWRLALSDTGIRRILAVDEPTA